MQVRGKKRKRSNSNAETDAQLNTKYPRVSPSSSITHAVVSDEKENKKNFTDSLSLLETYSASCSKLPQTFSAADSALTSMELSDSDSLTMPDTTYSMSPDQFQQAVPPAADLVSTPMPLHLMSPHSKSADEKKIASNHSMFASSSLSRPIDREVKTSELPSSISPDNVATTEDNVDDFDQVYLEILGTNLESLSINESPKAAPSASMFFNRARESNTTNKLNLGTVSCLTETTTPVMKKTI